MEGRSEVRELKVLGDWAYLRGYLRSRNDAARRLSAYAARATRSPFSTSKPMGVGCLHATPTSLTEQA